MSLTHIEEVFQVVLGHRNPRGDEKITLRAKEFSRVSRKRLARGLHHVLKLRASEIEPCASCLFAGEGSDQF